LLDARARQTARMNIDHEIELLKTEIRRLGTTDADGRVSVKFGVIVKDDRCANIFEALVGTLKAAKKRKVRTDAGRLVAALPAPTWH